MPALNIDASHTLQLTVQDLIGKSTAVLGITGSGKTNTTAVLIEELLSSSLPLTVVDIEGEYWGLKEKFEILVAGRSPNVEVEVTPSNAGDLADISVKRSISVILDLSDFHQEEIYEFLNNYFLRLWEACSAAKRPYQVILEEAHEFVPQGASNPLKQLLTRLALRGRKRGLGMILVSQRSAKVEKDLLTQASLLFLHKVVHPIDLKIYKDIVPLPSGEVERIVRTLQPGWTIVVSNSETSLAQVRLRHTFHAGSTPTHEIQAQPRLRRINAAILKELQHLGLNKQSASAEDQQAKFADKIKALEDTLLEKDAEIERLKHQIELLSKLTVSLEQMPGNTFNGSAQHLEVAQALVGQLITNHHQQLPLTVVEPQRISSEELASVEEQRKLESLTRRLQKLPHLQISILRLLTEHEGTAMTVSMMASWLSLKEGTLRSRPPHDLLKMKLIIRTRGSHGYQYTSALPAFLKQEFPETAPGVALTRLWHKLNERVSMKKKTKK